MSDIQNSTSWRVIRDLRLTGYPEAENIQFARGCISHAIFLHYRVGDKVVFTSRGTSNEAKSWNKAEEYVRLNMDWPSHRYNSYEFMYAMGRTILDEVRLESIQTQQGQV